MAKQIIQKFGILGEGCFLEDASIGPSFLTETKSLKASEILNLGTNPFLLLPTPGKGFYFDIQKIIFSFKVGVSAYSLIDPYLKVYSPNGYNLSINKKIITESNDIIIISGGYQTIADPTNFVTIADQIATNSDLLLSTFNGNNPTNGTGQLTIKIQYTIEQI